MDKERMERLKFQRTKQVNRMLGFVKHTQHTDYRKATIAKILKIDVKDVEQLLQCMKAEWKYIKEGDKR